MSVRELELGMEHTSAGTLEPDSPWEGAMSRSTARLDLRRGSQTNDIDFAGCSSAHDPEFITAAPTTPEVLRFDMLQRDQLALCEIGTHRSLSEFAVFDIILSAANHAIGRLHQDWLSPGLLVTSPGRRVSSVILRQRQTTIRVFTEVLCSSIETSRAPQEVRDLLASLRGLEDSAKLDEGLDLIFETVNAWLDEGRNDLVNHMFSDLDIERAHIQTLVGVLVATLPVRASGHRKTFVESVRKILAGKMPAVDVEAELEGLE